MPDDAPPAPGLAPPRTSALVALLPALVAAGLGVAQLRTGQHWSGVASYDDGPYVSSAVELAHGIVPYRDYAFVQPPGLTTLLAPIALLCRLIHLGTQDVLVAARLLTVVVTAALAAAVALLVRRFGAVAMVAAGLGLACFPAASSADSTALLEPYLDLVTVVGLLVLLSAPPRNRAEPSALAPARLRLATAGLVMGLAFDFKLWAALPAVVALVACVASGRRPVSYFVGGMVAGGVATIGPFVALDPSAFLRDVIGAQASRLNASAAVGVILRLREMFGVAPQMAPGWLAGATAALLVVAALVVAARRTGPLTDVEWCSLALAVLIVPVCCVARPFFVHYVFFLTPWLAILGGTLLGRACSALSATVAPVGALRLVPSGALALAVVLLAGASGATALSSFRRDDQSVREASAVQAVASLPARNCVVSDETSVLLSADRLSTGQDGCPVIVDAYGVLLVANVEGTFRGHSFKPVDRAVAADWTRWFGRADDVYLSHQYRHRIPWTPSLARAFHDRFVRVPVRHGIGTLYELRGHRHARS